MSKSLYCLFDPHIGGITFGIQPYSPDHWRAYGTMTRKVGLKADMGWREVQHLQNVLRKSDIWQDFPAKGYSLVAAEFRGGDEDQRIDILYIRDDGALLPCELKIGGESVDSHGQLIRYISDLYFQHLDVAWVQRYHQHFLDSITDDVARNLHAEKLRQFLEANHIEDRFVRLLPRSGIIMDESFKPQILKAVRYLNGYCGFAIRLIQIEAFVADDWTSSSQDYLFRIDFTDVQ